MRAARSARRAARRARALRPLSRPLLRTRSAAAKTELLEAHHVFARKAAAHAAVLLKNEPPPPPAAAPPLLPLRSDESLAIIGSFAEAPRYQGAGTRLAALLPPPPSATATAP